MYILTLVSIGLAIAGLVGLARKGVPESISGAVWAKAEKLRWIWSWWIACVAFSLLVPLKDALDDVAWLGWLTVVCLLGAGYPMFHDESKHWHKICAVAAGVAYTFPLTLWKQMLNTLIVYVSEALNVTEGHKAAIQALQTIQDVEDYDFTTGYPQKLVFTIE